MAHVFISYQHDDVDFAENLKHRVEKAGFEVWMDSDKLSAGEDWREGIDQGIKTASALLVVMTPGAKASEYVTYEWAFAWGAGVPVIPLMLKPTPLHPRLEALQYLDFTNRARPWDRLLARLETISKQPAATPKPVQQTSTIEVPDDAPPYLKQAILDLDNANGKQRVAAVKTLAQINLPEAREALLAALNHPLQGVFTFAARELVNLKEQRATPILIHYLYDVDDNKARHAAQMLGEMQDPSAIPALVSILRNGKGHIRLLVATSLGALENSYATSDLVEALNDKDPKLRGRAAIALGRIGDANAVTALIAHLNDKEHAGIGSRSGHLVMHIVADALERIATPEALAAAEEWRKQRDSAQPAGENQ